MKQIITPERNKHNIRRGEGRSQQIERMEETEDPGITPQEASTSLEQLQLGAKEKGRQEARRSLKRRN
ncbi:hypothetical protein C922_05673 [Plasmodium inui San Antonio 1]|uniref:Uncharacterized protein n=1 Tax=Plasmodium inui San Antonio 1 TaxID=1237626 RepID=W7AF78_9APIC|nr:hypothetical protein C922_05673 [Plasmodium inui San Antonio 1]EUD63946.1 hypothetical protein C922_05673 [Plasmodium inui San Antonio 1]